MALKIRLRPQGRVHRPFYRIVVADCHTPRNGRYVEALGWYNPFETEKEKHLSLKEERLQYWIEQGAVMTENVEALAASATPDVIKKKRERERGHLAKIAAKRKARKKTREKSSEG